MRRDAQPPTTGIYRPRNPRSSPLYQCVRPGAIAGWDFYPLEKRRLVTAHAKSKHHGFGS